MAITETDLLQKIKSRDNFIMKFNDNPFNSSGVLSPGWAEPTYDKFLTIMTEDSNMLDTCRMVDMTAQQHDLDELKLDVELEDQRLSNGNTKGLPDSELGVTFNRKILNAGDYVGKIIVKDNFIDRNIEKQNFFTLIQNQLAERMGPAFIRTTLYGKSGGSNSITGYNVRDGIIKQLETIAADSTDAIGVSATEIDESTKPLDAVMKFIKEAQEQDMIIDEAVLFVPPTFKTALLMDATTRQTDLGDKVLIDGGELSVLGVKVIKASGLRTPKNGYTNKYIILTLPNNLAFGLFGQTVNVKFQWDIDILGYKVAGLVSGDVKVHNNFQTAAAKIKIPI